MNNSSYVESFGLAGRVCVVTGAGSGIGRAIALTLAQAGGRVAVLDRNDAGSAETLAQIKGLGAEAAAFHCDTSDEASVACAAQASASALGNCEVLVNNAGVLRPGPLETLSLHSAAGDRATYLQRPDLGRRLDEPSRERLLQWRAPRSAAGDETGFDLAFVVADGLSAQAVPAQAVPLLAATLALLAADRAQTWQIAPVAVVGQARVAVGDEVGLALKARCVVVLIGERPGLSSPDSLGLYLTWQPRPGLVDANRNCISNVRPAGLAVDAAAVKLVQMLAAARTRQVTGVTLKDELDEQALLSVAKNPAA